MAVIIASWLSSRLKDPKSFNDEVGFDFDIAGLTIHGPPRVIEGKHDDGRDNCGTHLLGCINSTP